MRLQRAGEYASLSWGGVKDRWITVNDGTRIINRVLDAPIPRKWKHPTEKPVSLLEHFIRMYTDEGDVVLDPFLGSGSVAEACFNLKRECVGFEMEPKYMEIIKRRLAEAERRRAETLPFD